MTNLLKIPLKFDNKTFDRVEKACKTSTNAFLSNKTLNIKKQKYDNTHRRM